MTPKLKEYLAKAYRRNILGESVEVTPLTDLSDVVDEIKTEIASIDALKLGANLAQRDFGLYQRRRALVALLSALEIRVTLRATEARDTANFRK